MSKKLQTFIEELSPQARHMLVASVEAAKNRGESQPQFDMILSFARPLVRKNGVEKPRRDHLMRSFFDPFTQFLFDGSSGLKFPGRIARSSLKPIWIWITRDVVPGRVDQLMHEFNLKSGNFEESDIAACGEKLRGEVLPTVRAHLKELREVPRGYARLASQLGGMSVIKDLEDLLAIDARYPVLAAVLEQMPDVITAHDIEKDSPVTNRIRRFLTESSGDGDWLAVALLARLDHPALLVPLAVVLGGTDNGKALASTPFSVFVRLALHQLEYAVAKVQHDLHVRVPTDQLLESLRAYHLVQRKLAVEIDLDSAPDWFAIVASARRDISEAIKAQIEPVAGMVNRTLRHNPANEASARFDDYEAEDAERGLAILAEVRRCRESFALNEVLTVTWRRVEQALELLSAALLETLRKSTGHAAEVVDRKLASALHFSSMVFGEEYTKTMRRSRANALQASSKKASNG
ncbi:MAG: hypothetical protein C0606_00580 [Hyphomicrobiales bacterium]|nr:MAG: hypothetical protein C0606_00580 [Hyphomicrobiales bacterium]